jgi:hypothetical protein
MRPIASIGLPSLLILALATDVDGQPRGTVVLPTGAVNSCFPSEGAHLAFVQGDRVRAAYELLLERSPTFAGALAAIEAENSMRIRIGYPEHVMPVREGLEGEQRGGAAFLAGDGVFHPHGTILCDVRVVLFTERLEDELLMVGVPEEALVLDLAVMIAHEVFGHLVPFAEQPIPVWPTPCRDPDHRRARRTTGCAVDRENLIRQELSLPERRTYAQVDGPLMCELTGAACRFRRAAPRLASTRPVPIPAIQPVTLRPTRSAVAARPTPTWAPVLDTPRWPARVREPLLELVPTPAP